MPFDCGKDPSDGKACCLWKSLSGGSLSGSLCIKRTSEVLFDDSKVANLKRSFPCEYGEQALVADADLLYLEHVSKKMLTLAMPPTGNTTHAPCSSGISAHQMAPATTTLLPQYLPNGTTAAASTTGTSQSSVSSVCSTPVTVVTPSFGIQQSFPNTGFLAPPTSSAGLSLNANGSLFEGVPIFLVPQTGIDAGTVSLAAIHRAADSQYTPPQPIQPKVDTSKHFHVFVGDLSPEVDADILRSAFHKYGNVSDSKIIRDAQTMKSKGYGFVSFPEKESAEKAIEGMQGQMIGRRAVRTNWAQRRPSEETAEKTYEQIYHSAKEDNTTVYVGNVHVSITSEDIEEQFKQYGTVKEIRVFKQQGYAFVRFAAKNEAARAILKMNGAQLGCQTVKCSWGRTQEKTLPQTPIGLLNLAAINAVQATNVNPWAQLCQPYFNQIVYPQWHP
ncbi:hypothetical protein QR680_001786 [Steinernema hermaphroditum]|uniref:RRM domain-containing protein n=1 Tax=Steinernema hermaphroditum TaxID=289476 RepID=A0AA39H1I9_9BILA|nr:hypothetical protein QR680_001786 [Steinernema hermaphroditum]